MSEQGDLFGLKDPPPENEFFDLLRAAGRDPEPITRASLLEALERAKPRLDVRVSELVPPGTAYLVVPGVVPPFDVELGDDGRVSVLFVRPEDEAVARLIAKVEGFPAE